jgi:serine phosphatase RsbU (regulator of sigma subunit)
VKITKSINYAKSIQQALLPRKEVLNDYLPESFIFFRPRDVVSGDFYWFTEVNRLNDLYETKEEFNNFEKLKKQNGQLVNIQNNKFVLSAVDCTGHGVPGAFMSMIGYNLLDEIIATGHTRADIILNELHKGVRRALKQDVTENRDGMDMGLCVINNATRTISFAGAKNPLLYIKDGEIHELKADRNPIGGLQTEKKRKFQYQELSIDKPTSFYLFSDGFVDQFGGPKRRKFLMKNLKKLLIEIHGLPMAEQEKRLAKTFDEWKGTRNKQIDDVLVIGFKLGQSVVPQEKKQEKAENVEV